jgi:hypothetical protein
MYLKSAISKAVKLHYINNYKSLTKRYLFIKTIFLPGEKKKRTTDTGKYFNN